MFEFDEDMTRAIHMEKYQFDTDLRLMDYEIKTGRVTEVTGREVLVILPEVQITNGFDNAAYLIMNHSLSNAVIAPVDRQGNLIDDNFSASSSGNAWTVMTGPNPQFTN
jgi:hypothetical protein